VNHKHKESYDAKVEFEITKELISIRKSKKDRQHNDKKRQRTIYKTLHRKLKIEQHEPHLNPGENLGAPEG
jgi:hypothetical protein